MSNDLILDLRKILKRISRPQIIQWIDSEALSIIESKYIDVDIAQLVFNQFGTSAIIKKIRVIYLNTFELREIHSLAESKGIIIKSNHEYYQSFKIFITLFSFSSKWVDHEKKDFPSLGLVCPEFKKPLISNGKPHYYQLLIKNYCINWILDSIFPQVLVAMPTGSGKTRTANEFLVDVLRIGKVKKILWLAHRRELLYQTAKSFVKLYEEKGDDCINVSFNFDSHVNWFNDACSKQIIYSSYDKILNEDETRNFNIDIIIIDEAHYTTAETYLPKIKSLLRINEAKLLGLTATPIRADDELFRNLLSYYQYHINLNDVLSSDDSLSILQNQEYLAKIDYGHLNISYHDFKQESPILNDAIINRCRLYESEGKNILIFAMSKAHAIALNAMLNLEGISSSCIIGETPFGERDNIMDNFEKKKLTAIVNYDILTTGIDIPGMNGILVLRRFNERHIAIQVIGRALRGPKNGGNAKNDVIFINVDESKDINELYNY